jgi:hypothetical protein
VSARCALPRCWRSCEQARRRTWGGFPWGC